jgi:hypothetical protein
MKHSTQKYSHQVKEQSQTCSDLLKMKRGSVPYSGPLLNDDRRVHDGCDHNKALFIASRAIKAGEELMWSNIRRSFDCSDLLKKNQGAVPSSYGPLLNEDQLVHDGCGHKAFFMASRAIEAGEELMWSYSAVQSRDIVNISAVVY